MRTRKTYNPDITREHIDFGTLDSRGRKMGACIVRQTVTFEPASDHEQSGLFWSKEPGVYYAWWPHATRNGETYGALQGEKLCETPEEREQAIAKYLAGARKRASKATKRG